MTQEVEQYPVTDAALKNRRDYLPFDNAHIALARKMCEGDTHEARSSWYVEICAILFGQPMNETERQLSDRLLKMHTEKLREYSWYHGGKPCMKPGDLLLPSVLTGNRPRERGFHDEVYFTTTHQHAYGYATAYPGGGQVYRVKPLGQIEIDRQRLRAIMLMMGDAKFPVRGHDIVDAAAAYCAPRAQILEVVSEEPEALRPIPCEVSHQRRRHFQR